MMCLAVWVILKYMVDVFQPNRSLFSWLIRSFITLVCLQLACAAYKVRHQINISQDAAEAVSTVPVFSAVTWWEWPTWEEVTHQSSWHKKPSINHQWWRQNRQITQTVDMNDWNFLCNMKYLLVSFWRQFRGTARTHHNQEEDCSNVTYRN